MKQKTTNNPNGRPKGIPNKTTAELKTLITNFVNENLDTMQQEFEMLPAGKKMLFFEKLLSYVVPKAIPTPPENEQEMRPFIIEVSSEEAKEATEKLINSDD